MSILIKNGRVIDPANNRDEILDILVEGEKISMVAKNIGKKSPLPPLFQRGEDVVIDASGKLVLPGLVDMHVHLREPGREDKETVLSGTKAALKGGVTSVLAMPNTLPAIDSPKNVELLQEIISNSARANVFICAAITKKREGRELTDVAALKKYGAIAISDDGASVGDDKILGQAFKKAWQEGLLVICHCEDKIISNHGVVNLGFISTKLGLRGIPKESEYKRIKRDIELAEQAQARIHIAHVSCNESVAIIANAKKRGVKVTAETAPHYFCLTQEAVSDYDTNMKMNPPLRTKDDLQAIKHALKEGIIDVIASDHAPHTINEKDIEFERAEFGIIGLETELAVSISELIDSGLLDWPDLVKKLSVNPAVVLGIDKGTLTQGKDADIIIVNPDKEWVVKKEDIISKSKNSPFIDRKLKGIVECAICAGSIAYKNG
ncbi:MAG: dihydroorotase [Candidatus Omnitrophota bacterium]